MTDRSPLIPLTVTVHWTEAGDSLASEGEVLPFDEFERRALSHAMRHTTGGYLKTKITVEFADAEADEGRSRYSCRIDLAPDDERGFRHGIEQRIAFCEREHNRKMAEWPADMRREHESLLVEWWGRMRFDPAVGVGRRVRANGHDGVIVAMPGEDPSLGYVPACMVGVRLPGGVVLVSMSELEPASAPAYRTELTPQGEQMVIPGCEKKPSPWARGPQQMSLF